MTLVRYESRDHVATITMMRSEAHNVRDSDDLKEGVSAFKDKRKPAFKGK